MMQLNAKQLAAGAFLAGATVATGMNVAAEPISDRFDGAYAGSTMVSSGLSGENCTALPLVRVEIKNGVLRAWSSDRRRIVSGIVTSDGFFTGDYVLPDGRKTLIEGIVDGEGELTGGIVDGGCAWIARMSKSRT